MTDYTISLSDTLSAFIKKEVAEGGYENETEYITELLSIQRVKHLPKDLSDLEKLQLFNRKAERLEQYSLWKYLENNKPSSKVSKGIISNNFPDDELIEAPLITLRLFMQNNDYISIRNIHKIYNSNPDIPDNLKNLFIESREELNKFLDEDSLFSIQSLIWMNERERYATHYTNREILKSLLYGEIAHFTQREDYQKLYGKIFDNTFNLMQFMDIIKKFKEFILKIKGINHQTIPHLE